jgi:ubiquitin carboxyl-terminal hydrolase 4/11
MNVFALEVLFLMDMFDYQEQQKRTEQLMSFSPHPRQLLTKKQKLKSQESLDSCLEQFRMVEKLSANDSWYCSECKAHVEATKKMELYTTAPYLVMSLNRFKQHNTYFKEKLEDLIKFPINELDMTKHVLSYSEGDKTEEKPALIYELIGVINHYG